MARTPLFLGALATLLGVAGILAANAAETATASDTRSVERSFTADTVRLRNLSATLRIETHDGDTVKFFAAGPAKEIDALRTELAGNTLLIEAPDRPHAGNVSNVVHVENNVVINRGGNSTVIIGGVPATTTSTADPIDVRLLLPRSTRLAIRGFTGAAAVAAISAPVDLELLAGSARFERLAAASLSIAGGGEVEIDRADGSLDLTIDGAGDVTVRKAAIPSLTLETNGTATVIVDGRVETAEMSLNGIADIWIAHVEAEPLVEANGLVTIEIGNR
jgi:hypothetical protein